MASFFLLKEEKKCCKATVKFELFLDKVSDLVMLIIS